MSKSSLTLAKWRALRAIADAGGKIDRYDIPARSSTVHALVRHGWASWIRWTTRLRLTRAGRDVLRAAEEVGRG